MGQSSETRWVMRGFQVTDDPRFDYCNETSLEINLDRANITVVERLYRNAPKNSGLELTRAVTLYMTVTSPLGKTIRLKIDEPSLIQILNASDHLSGWIAIGGTSKTSTGIPATMQTIGPNSTKDPSGNTLLVFGLRYGGLSFYDKAFADFIKGLGIVIDGHTSLNATCEYMFQASQSGGKMSLVISRNLILCNRELSDQEMVIQQQHVISGLKYTYPIGCPDHCPIFATSTQTQLSSFGDTRLNFTWSENESSMLLKSNDEDLGRVSFGSRYRVYGNLSSYDEKSPSTQATIDATGLAKVTAVLRELRNGQVYMISQTEIAELNVQQAFWISLPFLDPALIGALIVVVALIGLGLFYRRRRGGFPSVGAAPGRRPLKERIDDVLVKLRIEARRLDGQIARLEARDKETFAKCVKSSEAGDKEASAMYANECDEIRKIAKAVLNSKFALERVILRLETVEQFGDLYQALAPLVGIVRSTKQNLEKALPEISFGLAETEESLNSLVIDAGQTSAQPLPAVSYSEEADKILHEASIIADQKMKEKFPELPTTRTPEKHV
jgi:division protein CdvB (Snf7/Vps24/ESCRT-III family)